MIGLQENSTSPGSKSSPHCRYFPNSLSRRRLSKCSGSASECIKECLSDYLNNCANKEGEERRQAECLSFKETRDDDAIKRASAFEAGASAHGRKPLRAHPPPAQPTGASHLERPPTSAPRLARMPSQSRAGRGSHPPPPDQETTRAPARTLVRARDLGISRGCKGRPPKSSSSHPCTRTR